MVFDFAIRRCRRWIIGALHGDLPLLSFTTFTHLRCRSASRTSAGLGRSIWAAVFPEVILLDVISV